MPNKYIKDNVYMKNSYYALKKSYIKCNVFVEYKPKAIFITLNMHKFIFRNCLHAIEVIKIKNKCLKLVEN